MSETVRCPSCGAEVPPAARFCPACGRPRGARRDEPLREAASTGVPYEQVLQRARAEDALTGSAAEVLARIATRLDRVEARAERVEERLRAVEAAVPGRSAPTPAAPEREAAATPEPAVPPAAPLRKPIRPVAAAPAPEVVAPPRPAPLPTGQPLAAKPAHAPTDWEQLVSGRGLAWTGGLAMIVGAIFFFSLAFSRGWIGPSARVVIGVAAGAALIGGGAWFFDRRERLFGHVLVAVGLGIESLSMIAATRLYELIPVEIGLLGALVSAVAAAAIAARADSQVVAGYGIVSALAAPPVLGAEPSATTIAFLATALVGSTGIALYRTWVWLPALAFVLSAPQLADWVVLDASRAGGLVALAGFWLLHAVAAGGEEFRVRRGRLRPSSATLLLANAALAIWLGFALLDGDAEGWRGTFLLGLALAHGALGGFFLRAEGDRHPFGMLACGTGVAALTMAVPVQFGGPVVPMAWAAEAVALAWIYDRRAHGYSGALSLILGALAGAHLFTIEYPLWELTDDLERTRPYLHAEGGTAAYLLGALAAAGYLVRAAGVRSGLLTAGTALVAVTLPSEVSGIRLLAAWSALFVLVAAARRWEGFADGLPVGAEDGLGGLVPWLGLRAVQLAVGGLAMAHLVTSDLPFDDFGWTEPARPFVDRPTLAALIVAAAGVYGAVVGRDAVARRWSLVGATAAVALLVPFEVGDAATVVGWSALALAPLGLADRDRAGGRLYLLATGVLLGFGGLWTIAAVAPPARLFVDATSAIDHALLWSGATAALASLTVVLVTARGLFADRPWARLVGVAAGALAVYLLSVGVVDEFQRRVGGEVGLESLQKRAQVALSILWAVLGGAAFIGGVFRAGWGAPLRVFGLALLGLATAKVFVYDLASLDTSYRVLSFIGLGLLLLVSSYVYQHVRPGRGEGDDRSGTGDRPEPPGPPAGPGRARQARRARVTLG